MESRENELSLALGGASGFIFATLISIFLAPILDTLLTFLTPKDREYFIRVEIRQLSIIETVKNPRSGQISLLDSLDMFRQSNTNKVSISDYSFNLVPVVSTSFVSL